MQNMVRRLFSDKAWLEDVFAQLDASGKVQVFERFQASTSWDPATHRTITVRMSKLDEATLASHVVRKVEVKVAERTTSQRSYNEKKAAYDRLVNVDMPANTKRIEFARGFGTLYTAVYRPGSRAVTYRWPDDSWHQSLAAFTPGTRTVRLSEGAGPR